MRTGRRRVDQVGVWSSPRSAAARSRSTRPIGTSLGALCAVLLLLMLSVSGVTWSSRQAAERARWAVEVNEVLHDATLAVAAEESTERKYLLEPSGEARKEHARAQARLDADMRSLRPYGSRTLVEFGDAVGRENLAYTKASLALFEAADRHLPQERIEEVDSSQVDPAFVALSSQVWRAALTWHARALDEARRAARAGFVALVVDVVALLVALASFGLVGRRLVTDRRLLQRQNARNEHQALHDGLTGLPNRVMLAERLQAALLDRPDGGVSVAVLDLDRFKEINDTLGHHCGDALLSQIGPRLATALRRDDLLCRLGGDEFAVLLRGSGAVSDVATEHRAVVERVVHALERPFDVEGLALSVEGSLGMATSGLHGSTAEELLRHADSAMYEAKRRHGGVVVFDAGMAAQTPRQLTLLTELRAALQADELVLHYQPLVDLASGRPVGLEALVRWAHPRDGLLPPDRFVPAAEGSGLILPMTRHVIGLACREARTLLERGYLLPIAVNVSPRCLQDSALPQMISDACVAADLPPEMLAVELTESAIIADPGAARDIVERLRALGVRVALDDFGTGYTSLAYLRDLPITEIKVDRRFVAGMRAEAGDRAVVDAAALLAERLDMVAVAEGIEDADTAAAALWAGCQVGQGYHFARPMGIEALHAWLPGRYVAATPDRLPG